MTTEGNGGTQFTTIEDLWQGDSSAWYGKAMEYWSSQDASINGVLGGFGNLHPLDLMGSEKFMTQVFSPAVCGVVPSDAIVADCGAGVGRISQFLLSKRFPKFDLIEPCGKLLDQAKLDLAKTVPESQIGEFIHAPLQTWIPEREKYFAFWHQWVLLYLKDDDCVAYLERCRSALLPGGVILVKENVAMKSNEFEMDPEDNSVTRSLDQYMRLFALAGLKVAFQLKQPRWPSGLFPVLMFALVPV
jgi:protein N-terminal methyltransferase